MVVLLVFLGADSCFASELDERLLDRWKRTSEVAIQNYHDGRYAEAESQFKAALVEIRKVKTDSNQELFTLARITEISLKRKNGKKADRQFLAVQALYRKLSREKKLNRESVAELDRLADSFIGYKTKDRNRREKYLLNCLNLRDIVSGDSHKYMVEVLRAIVVFYRSYGDFHKAEPYAIRLVRLDQLKSGFESVNVAMELFNLGIIKFHLKKYVDSESYFRQSLAILIAMDNIEPWIIPNIKAELANTLLAANKNTLANTEAKQALSILTRRFGEFCKESIRTRQVLADSYEAIGNKREAAHQREVSVKLVNKFYGINNPMNLKELKALKLYYKQTGNTKRAKKITQELKVIEALTQK